MSFHVKDFHDIESNRKHIKNVDNSIIFGKSATCRNTLRKVLFQIRKFRYYRLKSTWSP